MMWQFNLLEVAIGTLVGLLMSRLFYARALSMAPGSTRRRVFLVGSALILTLFVLWLGLSSAGDVVLHAASRGIPDTGMGIAYVALNVVIVDSVVTALTKALERRQRPAGRKDG